MSTDAVVLVRIPAHSLPAHSPAAQSLAALGEGVTVRALDDGSLLCTTLSMREADPSEIAAEVGSALGALLAMHAEPRGLFIFPAAAIPKATSYDAVIEEVGEMGEWASIAAADPGFDMMDMQRELMSNPAAMQAAMAQVSAVLADPEQAKAIAEAMKDLTGGADLSGMLAQLGQMDPAELQRQAQALYGGSGFGGAGGLPKDPEDEEDPDDR